MGQFMAPLVASATPELIRQLASNITARADTTMPASVAALQAPAVAPPPPAPAQPDPRLGFALQQPAPWPYPATPQWQPPQPYTRQQLAANAVDATQQAEHVRARAATSAAAYFWGPVGIGVAGGLGLVAWAILATKA